ncbi:MAG: magnesium transporter CorA family protein [Actinobacteria bacterium]|nr:magnesium transporter CorA family protein [Actinomycetota bacterium]
MLTIRWMRDGRARTIPLSALADALAGDGYVWIDLSAPTPEERAVLDHPALSLDPFAREDILEDTHLPKLDVHDDHLLLVVHAVEVERSAVELATGELDIAVGDDWMLTHHARALHPVAAVGEMVDRGLPGLDRPALVVHRILDVMDDVFVPFLDLMGQRLDLVEEDVLETPTAATRSEIFALRRDLITLRRISVPQAEVIRQLSREQVPMFTAGDRALFRDVYDHIHRLAEVSEAYRQLVESAYDMYRSVRDDETNRRLTVLTMVSTVLLPITVLAGIYGMNFEHMPELDERWAYPALWGVFGAIITGGLLLFRRWGWLGGGAEDEQMAKRRSLVERIEVPVLGQVLKVPAYGTRFAVRSGRLAVRGGGRLVSRLLGRRRRPPPPPS